MKTLLLAAGLVAAAPSPTASLVENRPVALGGVQAVCTGPGIVPADAPWRNFPVRVEFFDSAGKIVGGLHLTLNYHGKPVASLDCKTSWVLLKLPAGQYTMTAAQSARPDAAQHISFFTDGTGPQQRLELEFSGGETSVG